MKEAEMVKDEVVVDHVFDANGPGHPMCETLMRIDIVVAGTGKTLHPGKDGFTVTAAIPKSLDKASRSGQQQ